MSEEKKHKEDEEQKKAAQTKRSKDTVTAITGLLKAVELAQSKGAYTFKESIEIYDHVKFFKKD